MGSTKEEAPKTYSIRITDNTQQNIDDITGYIAFIKYLPLNAIRVGDKIFETIDRIKKSPLVFGNVKKSLPKTKSTEKQFV